MFEIILNTLAIIASVRANFVIWANKIIRPTTLLNGVAIKPCLILIRGLPGSGKTTLACRLKKHLQSIKIPTTHFEADSFFVDEDGYNFNPALLGQAHAWCQCQAMEALAKKQVVIVSNTFISEWEMSVYLSMAKVLNYDVITVRCDGEYDNIHSVPTEVLAGMKERMFSVKEEIVYSPRMEIGLEEIMCPSNPEYEGYW